ncbi:MAG: bifunctional diaminohydroxyphosphoribosylaminopyrimidine deaminase/5-amino-6-(5-phosphoribosylamino)uracil reductase RibD [Myxococcales bacterium]
MKSAHSKRPSAPSRPEMQELMRLAIAEARKGLGRTSPNPSVGAIVVKDGKVVARGFHAKAGGPHAEVVALRKAAEKARGADLYVTLEPCDHHGRTPPCTAAILAAGIKRVFVGCEDANPIVSGRGIKRLRAAGVSVVRGVLEDECLALNRPFFTFITERRPFVTLKVASTADGRIATATGDSRWVTGPEAREKVHGLREQIDAILVGARTVREDDPQLTARPKGKLSSRQPLRVILTRTLDVPPSAKIFDEPTGGVLVLTTSDDAKRTRALEKRGVEVVRVPGGKRGVDLRAALELLHERDIVHLMVEGGGEVFGAFLEEGLADQLMLFIAPKNPRGGRGLGAAAGEGEDGPRHPAGGRGGRAGRRRRPDHRHPALSRSSRASSWFRRYDPSIRPVNPPGRPDRITCQDQGRNEHPTGFSPEQ